jgi:hypothetical protein
MRIAGQNDGEYGKRKDDAQNCFVAIAVPPSWKDQRNDGDGKKQRDEWRDAPERETYWADSELISGQSSHRFKSHCAAKPRVEFFGFEHAGGVSSNCRRAL